MPGELKTDECMLLCMDFQEKLLSKVYMAEEIADNAIAMIKSARALNIPVIVTEQYPKGLGRTIEEIIKVLGEDYKPIEKVNFNCFGSQEFIDKLESINRRSLLIMGVEAHICICQTVLEALRKEYEVYLLEDTISSRKPENRRIAIDRMIKEGSIPASVEMVIYELLKQSGTPEFKEILEFIR